MDKDKLEKGGAKKLVFNQILADKLAFWVLLLGILLLPFVFYPIPGTSILIVKKFFILLVILSSFLLWLIARFQTRDIKITRSSILMSSLLLPISFLISGLFSGAMRNSLIGNFYQSETFMSLLFSWLLFFLITQLFSDKNKLFNFYIFFCISGLLFNFYLLLRFFLGPILPSVYTGLLPVGLLGAWYENAIMLGLVAIITVSMLELLNLSQAKLLKVLLASTLVVSLSSLILINYSTVWLLLGLISLGLFIFSILTNQKGYSGVKSLVKYSSVVFIVSLVFFALGGTLAKPIDNIYNYFDFSFLDIRPGFNSTVEVIKGATEDNLLLGVGPNNFSNAWANYRPKAVNESLYWNTNFDHSFGLLPTYIVVSGLLGSLAMLILFITLLYGMFKGLVVAVDKKRDGLEKSLIVLSIVFNLYIWSILVFYIPNAIGLPLAFTAMGLLVATMVSVGLVTENKYSVSKSGLWYLISTIVLSILIIVTLFGVFNLTQRFWSIMVFSQAAKALAEGRLEEADSLLIKTLDISNKNPLYLRTFTGLKLRQLNDLLSTENLGQDEITSQAQNLIDISVSSAQEAVKLHPLDPQNLLVLGGAYEFLASLGVEGISGQAYTEAKNAYDKAFKLSPNNPEILFNMARLEISQSNFTTARDLLEQALTVKTNHNSSIILLSQLDIEDNNIPAAVARLEQALARNSTDTNLLFQLGILQYRNNNIDEAISALSKAIEFSQGGINANASYFLGLSYDANGQRLKAIEQFEIISRYNPDNREVNYILNNLRLGRPALDNINSASGVNSPSLNTSETPVEEDIALDNTDESEDE